MFRKNTSLPYRTFRQSGRSIEDIPYLSSNQSDIDANDLYLPSSFKSRTICWMDANKNLTIGNNNKISKWASKIGNYTFQQTNESMQPNLIKRDINGKDVVNFTGTQRLVLENNGILPKLQANYTFAVVAKNIRTNSLIQSIFCQDSTQAFGTNTSSKFAFVTRTSTNCGVDYRVASYTMYNYNQNKYNIFIFSNAPSSLNGWINGARAVFSTSIIKLLTGIPDTGVSCVIGSDFNPALNFFEGNIAEILVFDTNFTSLQSTDLLNYFKSKYNTQGDIMTLSNDGGSSTIEKDFELDLNLVFNVNFNGSLVERVSGLTLEQVSSENLSTSTTSVTFNSPDSLTLYDVTALKGISNYMTLFLRIKFPATPTNLSLDFNNGNGFSVQFFNTGFLVANAGSAFTHNTIPSISGFYDDGLFHWFVFMYNFDLGVIRAYVDLDLYEQPITNANENITFDTITPTEFFKISCSTPGVVINHLDILKRPLTSSQISTYRSYINARPTSNALITYNDYGIASVQTLITDLTSNDFTFNFQNVIFNDTFYNTTLGVDYKFVVTGPNFSYINYSNNNPTGTAAFSLNGMLEPSTEYNVFYNIMYANVELFSGSTYVTTTLGL